MEDEQVHLGPMSLEERAELLAMAEELRARNTDPVPYLRALLHPPPKERRGRKRGSARVEVAGETFEDPFEAVRNERRLALYDQTLERLKAFHKKAPRAARTVAQLRKALGLGDGFEPDLEAVEAYRSARAEGRTGGATLEALAASFAMDDRDELAALAELRRIRKARDRKRKRATE